MFRAFLITWLMVIVLIMYIKIDAGMTEMMGSVRLCWA
jgi:hypothetical protein